MPPEEKDVMPDPSTGTEDTTVVNTSADATATEDTTAQETTPEPSPGQTDLNVEIDERGVPWKNRAMEYQRKIQELSESIPQLIDRRLSEFKTAQAPQEQKYTISQLEQLAIERPEYRPWVEEQKEKLRMDALSDRMEERIKATESAKQAEFQKQKSYEYVIQNFPEAFLMDAQGKPVSWNNESPLTQEISRLMQDPRISKDPEGLMAAAEIAYGRVIRMKSVIQSKAQRQIKAKMKKIEQSVMVEGSGKPVPGRQDPFREAQKRLAQSGSMKDAESAVGEYFRKIGTLK